MEEGRMRVLAIVAGILVARHPEERGRSVRLQEQPANRVLVASAVQWAERIMRKIDSLFPVQ